MWEPRSSHSIAAAAIVSPPTPPPLSLDGLAPDDRLSLQILKAPSYHQEDEDLIGSTNISVKRSRTQDYRAPDISLTTRLHRDTGGVSSGDRLSDAPTTCSQLRPVASDATQLALHDVHSMSSTASGSEFQASPSLAVVPLTKRRKLTPEGEEQKKAPRDAIAAEAKACREAERVVRLAEAAEKKAKKAEAKKVKDEESRRKNDAAAAKKLAQQEALERKTRLQPTLSAFGIVRKSGSPTRPAKPSRLGETCSPARHTAKEEVLRRSHLISIETGDSLLTPASWVPTAIMDLQGQAKLEKKLEPQYEEEPAHRQHSAKMWKPFVVRKHVQLAPLKASSLETHGGLDDDCATLDTYASFRSNIDSSMADLFPKRAVPLGYTPTSIRQIISQLNSLPEFSVEQKTSAEFYMPAESTDLENNDTFECHSELLSKVTIKYLYCSEDHRPRFCGTWTRPTTLEQGRSLARNPVARTLPDVDYHYDSDCDWIDMDEEGDDVDDNEEPDDVCDIVDGGMMDFLDDSGADIVKRNKKIMIGNDQQPISSGLQWQDGFRVMHPADSSGPRMDFNVYEIVFLVGTLNQPIDPYSTDYWPGNGALSGAIRSPASRSPASGTSKNSNGKEKRSIESQHLDAFKRLVSDSDMTKIALIEHLKKRMPHLKKGEIIATLPSVAKRVGRKEADKRWVLL